jgi:hypothetical protein
VGVTAFDGDDAMLSPIAFRAYTVNVYVVPFDSPVKVAVVLEAPAVAVTPPGDDTTR